MFFFRSQFSFWAFPHQSLCLCCPGARLQRKGEAVPFFPSFIAKLCRLFSNIPKDRSLYNHLVGCRLVSRRHHNFLLLFLCSCLHPLSTKYFLSPNILCLFIVVTLFHILSAPNVFSHQIFSSFSFSVLLLFLRPSIFLPFHNKDQNFKRVLHCLLGLFFSFRFSTPTIFPSCLPLSTTVQW